MSQRIPLLIFLAFLFTIARPARASDDGDRVQFGRNIVISESENAGDLVCIGCSIRVDGTAQDAVAIGGSVLVNGTVKGDMAVIGGSANLGENATIDGDLATVGGRLNRHPNSVVKGEVSSRSGAPILIGIVLVPLIPILLIIALILWLVKPNRRPPPVRVWQPPPTA
jgi:NDP-sugar pyrophosphorylase family protein